MHGANWLRSPSMRKPFIGTSVDRLREKSEHRKNQRFSLKIVFCGVARGAVDLFPYLRQPRKARQGCVGIGVGMQARRPPSNDGVDKGRKHRACAAAERVAEGMKLAWIDLWQGVEQRRRALVQF